ncbi:hypothetical protein HMPREF9446_03762 [Bacteroides fluxus YIT 12057]|uniref:Uncharacterized protein n=1 Tax=Bacteroides fluxus YIT 12057 TaxID=763034 RepID=F3PYB4_9BACE|nr:hypothetical protein HMPREF9446_03762 [Bacteroides fluxus YIT 12057]
MICLVFAKVQKKDGFLIFIKHISLFLYCLAFIYNYLIYL